jgi:hypothetical protein
MRNWALLKIAPSWSGNLPAGFLMTAEKMRQAVQVFEEVHEED